MLFYLFFWCAAKFSSVHLSPCWFSYFCFDLITSSLESTTFSFEYIDTNNIWSTFVDSFLCVFSFLFLCSFVLCRWVGFFCYWCSIFVLTFFCIATSYVSGDIDKRNTVLALWDSNSEGRNISRPEPWYRTEQFNNKLLEKFQLHWNFKCRGQVFLWQMLQVST